MAVKKNVSAGRDEIVRLNRIAGQLKGIRAMIDDQRDIPDILTQLRAVRAAVKGMEINLLTKLLHSYAEKAFTGKAERNEKIDELIVLLRRYGEN